MSKKEDISVEAFKLFLQEVGAQIYGSCLLMENMGWNDGVTGLAIYAHSTTDEENNFLTLWLQSFLLGNKKAKDQLIKRFYGGKRNYNKFINDITLNL